VEDDIKNFFPPTVKEPLTAISGLLIDNENIDNFLDVDIGKI